ncbi:site-specific integrase [Enterococcus termitis]|uniref:Integrase n=1 Tax=Enterococcus termitis TaxID=332950 RepID=A0A1E5GTY0_9ENTE|nr:site-specific integrase [Enterococcus termitis]OEG16146.1 integrase [Enterococcus termitis]
MAEKKLDSRIKEKEVNGKTRYEAQLYLGVDPLNGKKRRTTLRSSKSAEDLDRKIKRKEADIKKSGLQPKIEQKKFKELFDLWFVNYKMTVKESTWASTDLLFSVHILPIFGDNYIDKMDVMFCQKEVNTWAENSPKNFKKYKNYTSNVFDYAVSIGVINSNPMKLITMPRGEVLDIQKKDIPFYNKKELNEFLEAAKDGDSKIYTFFFLLAYTGLRKGEALALEWSDINFQQGELTINKTLTRGENNRLIVNRPKTKSGSRTILIDDDLSSVLKMYKTTSGKVVSLNKKNSLVFSDSEGNHINPTMTKTWLKSVYRRYPKMKQISAHGFRHTHASLLFEAEVSLKDVQERLGHSDINITANVYTHVTENKNKQMLNKFANFMKNG